MTKPITKGRGKTFLWIVERVGYDGDDCLIWPFNRVRGYGTLAINGVDWRAPRLMCTLAHGEAPTSGHEAAHSCGRGHEGCMTPNHLSWKTRAENQRDRRAHGTTAGVWRKTTRRKLTPAQVEEIRKIGRSKTYDELAAMFGVSPSRVREVLLGIRCTA